MIQASEVRGGKVEAPIESSKFREGLKIDHFIFIAPYFFQKIYSQFPFSFFLPNFL
jgi:hypothetical protein